MLEVDLSCLAVRAMEHRESAFSCQKSKVVWHVEADQSVQSQGSLNPRSLSHFVSEVRSMFLSSLWFAGTWLYLLSFVKLVQQVALNSSTSQSNLSFLPLITILLVFGV